MRTHIAFAALLVAALAGCAAGHDRIASLDLKHSTTSAQKLYQEANLRAQTITACAAQDEAEYKTNMAMTGCKNAFIAQYAIDTGRGSPR